MPRECCPTIMKPHMGKVAFEVSGSVRMLYSNHKEYILTKRHILNSLFGDVYRGKKLKVRR